MTSPAYIPSLPQRFPGEALLRFRQDPIATLRRAARYGDLVRLPISRNPIFLLNHPELIKDVLVTQQKQFGKSKALVRAKKILGEGLLTSEGEFHLRQRRLVQPAFHRERVAAYGAVMTQCAVRMSQRWSPGETRDLHAEMMRLTLAVVGRTLFDADIESEADEIGGALAEVIALFHVLMLPFADLLENLPLPPVRRFRAARARLDATVFRMIREHRAAGDRGDLLSMLLEAKEDAGGGGMTDLQVRDEAMTLFLAGHETTANALVWTWYLLSQNPDSEAALHAELGRVLGGRTPTVDDVPHLPFTRQVFAEALRLYSPAWVVGRRALGEISLGGCRVPAGAIVLMAPSVMHYDLRFWPDPARFDPARWTAEAEEARPKFAFFPFGGGPRVCIGESFAWTEGILLLATLAQVWRLRLDPGQKVATQPIITLRPRFGMRMRLEKRHT